jgi:hypothetical protein
MAKNKGNNKGWDNLIPCKPGETANPNGRPKGQRNFATIYREAIEKIAKSKDITADEFEIQLVEQAIRKGFNGDTRFYTDTLDRIHGKATQFIDETSTTEVTVRFTEEEKQNLLTLLNDNRGT